MPRDKKPKYLSAFIPTESIKETAKRGDPKGDERMAQIEEMLAAIEDANAKNQRDQLDQMYNLEPDNLSVTFNNYINQAAETAKTAQQGVQQTQQQVQDLIQAIGEQGQSVAGIIREVNELSADVMMIARTQTSQGEYIAAVDAKTNSTSSTVSMVASRVTAAEGKVGQVVDSNNNIKVASIVAAVNNAGSSVMIGADKIRLNGTTSFIDRYSGNGNSATIISGNTFTIQGYCNNADRNMYQITYDYQGMTPYVNIDSPYDAYMRFGYYRAAAGQQPRFEFYGVVDFSNATIITK